MAETRRLDRFDFYLFGILCALLIISLVTIFGSSSFSPSIHAKAYTQLIAVLLGLTTLILAQLIDYRAILDHAYAIYWSSVVLLLGVLVFGIVVQGAMSWFTIPGIHFRVQPSEFMKVAFILALARCLGKRDRTLENLKEMVWPLILAGIPFALVVAQRDPGTALVFPLVTLCMLWAAGVRPVYLMLLVSPLLGILGIRGGFFSLLLFAVILFVVFRIATKAGVPWFDWGVFLGANILSYIAAPIVWEMLKPHQKDRLLVFLNPDVDPMGQSWNLIQSKVSLGSGGIWGKGWQQGTQIRGQFLPAFHTDFAFSVLGEEWGFVGCAIVLVLFFLLLMQGLEIACSTRHSAAALLVVGVIAMIFVHIVINVGMCMGVMPVIGIPLCFISYGGSSMMASLLAVSFLFNVQIHKFK